ncbi:MAG: redox-sensitive bicupin YhaK (pirin superfamily) [Bacteriovoracaceae bacterium]|jgi:redox-sensitive bicupin YhaK (pirin superfamily)
MITKRIANERGHFKLKWLDARHGFSFGSYFDPNWMGFSKLRVVNEDIIAPNGGFDTHPHKNMEIISFIVEGELEHKDTLGNNSIIKSGQIQIMSAGSGILHSEFNPSNSKNTHSLQIWVEPAIQNIKPRYEQFDFVEPQEDLVLLASPTGGASIAKIYQDAFVYFAHFKTQNFSKELEEERKYWIQVIQGEAIINGVEVAPGDAVAIENEKTIEIKSCKNFKFLFFDLP